MFIPLCLLLKNNNSIDKKAKNNIKNIYINVVIVAIVEKHYLINIYVRENKQFKPQMEQSQRIK